MKKSLILLLFAAMLASVSAGIHERKTAVPFQLENLTISAPQEFLPATQILSKLLEKIGKTQVPIAENGNIKFTKDAKLPPQGFTIVTAQDGINIAASNLDGAKFAVAFLARELGYRHFFPAKEWEIIPEKLPENIALNVTESPDYLSRSIWPSWGIWGDYRKATNFDEVWKILNFQGGIKVKCGHVYGRFIHHRRKVFAAHPEYYGLRDGKRNSTKLCISNPELRKLFTDYKLEKLAKNPDWQSVSAEPSDGGGWCECENCRKLGSFSTRAVILANETAKAVTAKYPGKVVGMYAYNQHSTAPDIDLHPGIVVNVATAFIKGGHTVDELIAAWRARKANVGIREYYFTNIAPGSGKGANPAYMKESLVRFYKLGARYITAEAGDCWGPSGLAFYSGANMMWNTGLSPEQLKADFLKRAFPKSRVPMEKFYALLDGASPRPLNADLLGRMYRHLDAARELASGREKQRVDALVCYTRFCELFFAHQNKVSWENYLALIRFGASIRHTRMVHTYSMFRSPRFIPRAWRSRKHDVNWKNTPAPTAAEIDRIVADGIKNNELLKFKVKAFSDDLVPVSDPNGSSQIKAGNSRRKATFFIWCDGKPFTLTVTGGLIKHYRDRGNVILELVQIGGESDTGELETVVQYDRSVPPDGKPRKVVFKPKHPGLHKIIINDNGDMSRIDWPENMAVALPVERESSRELNGSFYFFVPKGTSVLGFYAKTSRGNIIDPAGKTVLRLAKRNGYYSIKVDPEQCGKLWKINSMCGVVKFLTIPSHLALRSTHYLIPKEVKGK